MIFSRAIETIMSEVNVLAVVEGKVLKISVCDGAAYVYYDDQLEGDFPLSEDEDLVSYDLTEILQRFCVNTLGVDKRVNYVHWEWIEA